MKRLNLLIAVFFAVFFLASYSTAQCVQCLPGVANPDVFTCQAATSGGKECQPLGAVCTVGGVCRSSEESDRASIGSKPDSKICSQEQIGSVRIDSSFINQVSENHPRFAIALAALNQGEFLGLKDARISLLPIQLDKDVYDKWLNRISYRPTLEEAANGALFNRKTGLPKPVKRTETIIYSVKAMENADSGTATIRLEVVQGFAGDPAFSTLEITLDQIASSIGATKQWQVRNWEIR